MLSEKYAVLKSGTDIRGVATAGVEGEDVNLTDDVITEMTYGYVLWVEEKLGKKSDALTIAVGRDCRISGEHIASVVIEALLSCGVHVLDCGLSSTPAMFMTTVDNGCDASVQITASHHPFNRNGLKFFVREGGLDHGDITAILEHAQAGDKPACTDRGFVEKIDYMTKYAEHLCGIIKREVNADDYDHPLKGFHIVVDAGNGAGGFYESKVLSVLGADTSGSKFLEPDGMFPNHVPNPENEDAMKSICDAVVENHADLGVIFDTDVDRGGAVDRNGKEINRNRLVALSSYLALEGNEGGTVVTDSITSPGVTEYIEKTLGGKHYRYRRGYRNIINKAIELNKQGINTPIASETSGHVAMRENYFLDDGAYLCTKIIIKMATLAKEGKTLESLVESLKEPVEARELRFKITEHDFKSAGERVIKNLADYAEKQPGWHIAPDNREGIRVSFDKEDGDGWFLLRLSVHDPILPLNIESDSEGGVDIIQEKVLSFLKTQNGIEV